MTTIKHLTPVLTRWPIVALLASLSMLGAAHAFETFGKMPPCALCLHQREAYWAAVGVALLAIVSGRLRPDTMGVRAFGLLLACAFGAGALIAGFHMGVEFKWWPGLAACAGGGSYQASGDLLGALSKSMDVPACDKVAWSMLGISMAGWNMMISAGLAAVSFLTVAFPLGFKDAQYD